MLFAVENYRGGQIQEREVPQKVVQKTEVLNEAINLVRKLIEKPIL